MSWNIPIPNEIDHIALADAAHEIEIAPSMPQKVSNSAPESLTRKQVAAAKAAALDAIPQAETLGYKRVRIYLSGHTATNGSGPGDSFGVVIARRL